MPKPNAPRRFFRAMRFLGHRHRRRWARRSDSARRGPASVGASALALLLGLLVSPANGQRQSVRPGVNDSFRDPNVADFVGRFEGESREVFSHRAAIVKACRVKPGMVVADIGAGTGLFTRLFAARASADGKVYAVDIAAKFLDHISQSCAEENLRNVETILCKPDSAELPTGGIDLAFICDTYHHFEFPIKTMESIRRAMKPGGRVVVVDFRRIEGESSDWILGHVRAGQEVFEREILAAGFRRTKTELPVLHENYLMEFVAAGPSDRATAAPAKR